MEEGFSLVTDSEQEDFESAINSKELLVSDFEITQRPDNSTRPIGNISSSLIIKYKPTNKEIAYQAGTGTNWPMCFQQDLDNGSFE